MDIFLRGAFPTGNRLNAVGQAFIQTGSKAERTDRGSMTFINRAVGSAYPPGKPILSLPGSVLYEKSDGSGFQMNRFQNGSADFPFLFITINRNFTDFTFQFDRDRYQALFAEQGWPVDWFQYAISQNLLIHSLLHYNGLLVHSTGGIIQGQGMLFAAPSGTGKSTLSSLLLSSPGNTLFSEERLLIQGRVADKLQLWGTPWHGSGTLARNEKTDLAALVFLRQAAETTIQPLSRSTALERLIQVASIPWYSPSWTEKGLQLSEKLLRQIPAYELAFTPDQSAVQAVEQLAEQLK